MQFQDIALHNQSRIQKKANVAHGSHNQKKKRHTFRVNHDSLRHRIWTLFKRQQCSWLCHYYYPQIELSSVLAQDLKNQSMQMIKYWAGDRHLHEGLQFRKLGRMDKIKLKEKAREREQEKREKKGENESSAIEIRNKTAFLKRVFNKLQNKYSKWIFQMGLSQIQKCKKASRHAVLEMPIPITSR